jgi:hypothetical protein
MNRTYCMTCVQALQYRLDYLQSKQCDIALYVSTDIPDNPVTNLYEDISKEIEVINKTLDYLDCNIDKRIL